MASTILYFLRVLIAILPTQYVCAQMGITIDYTLENYITADDRVFSASLRMSVVSQPFKNIMDLAVDIDQRYRYTTANHGGLGEFVNSINGIYESTDTQRYWALLKRTSSGDCHMSVGITTYYPQDGEHLVFQYARWDSLWPTCPDV